jgi:hypothetical protein
MRYTRRLFLAAAALTTQLPVMAGAIPVKVYKNPSCYCCDLWGKHLEENGFKVELVNTTDMAAIKQKFGIPEPLEGCHTAIVNGYIVEGLVPAKFVRQMLDEHKAIKGIALPGMPVGAPGMPGSKSAALNVYVIGGAAPPKVFGSF